MTKVKNAGLCSFGPKYIFQNTLKKMSTVGLQLFIPYQHLNIWLIWQKSTLN